MRVAQITLHPLGNTPVAVETLRRYGIGFARRGSTWPNLMEKDTGDSPQGGEVNLTIQSQTPAAAPRGAHRSTVQREVYAVSLRSTQWQSHPGAAGSWYQQACKNWRCYHRS